LLSWGISIQNIEFGIDIQKGVPVYIPKHTHNNYQIIYIRKGSFRMEIEKNCYDVEGPSLVFISNFEQHSIEAVSGEYQKIFINLAPNFVETVLQSRQLLSIFCNRPEGFVHVVPLRFCFTR